MITIAATFKKYENLVKGIDQAVQQIREAQPDCFRCTQQCSECCYAVFDLSLIESVYINYHFYDSLNKEHQDPILERAERADRQSYRLKRKIHKMVTQGDQSEEAILSFLSEERLRCPFLAESDLCDLYAFRPITCRIYGLPTIIHGAGHSCGKSGFKEGMAYQSFNLDRINQTLAVLSGELLEEIGSLAHGLRDRLVPLSTALLTDYDEGYFDLKQDCSV
jgi:Fe-S-cluster containining protein